MDRLSELIDAGYYGGKAAGLALLIGLGFDVPDGFVIAADEPLDQARIWAAANKWTTGVDSSGNARLAVRSSALDEDGTASSHAGEFLSRIDTFSCRDLADSILAVRLSKPDMPIPVIVQTVVEPRIAGVAFSCDPLDLLRNRAIVSWVAGLSGPLVSGAETGTTIRVATGDPRSPEWPEDEKILRALVEGLTKIEDILDHPADVEWAVDASGRLWMLQARPVVLPRAQVVDANSDAALRRLPATVAAHSKMRLRGAAARRAVPMSKAVVVTASGSSPYPALPSDMPSDAAAALSIVLLHPNRLDDQIQREFAQVDRTDVPLFTLGCRRYSIRRYPDPNAAGTVLDDVLARGLCVSWAASAVVQEIYDAEATGIVRRLGEGFVVEIARGHFVPKGVVDPTRLVISSDGTVVGSDHAVQDVVYHFINGHVVTEQPAERQLNLTDAEIVEAAMQIAPLFVDYPEAALEFGVMKHRGLVHAYVIDIAEADSVTAAAELTADLIGTGVVSPGRAVGRATHVMNENQTDLDSHLLSRFETETGEEPERLVVLADRASVDLLPIASRLRPGSAFVFKHASLLAHLSVVLRERGIPAVVIDDDEFFASLLDGRRVQVNAMDSLPDGRARVTLVDE